MPHNRYLPFAGYFPFTSVPPAAEPTQETVSLAFTDYRSVHEARMPSMQRAEDIEDETRPIPDEERHVFGGVKANILAVSKHATALTDETKYLWVICVNEIVYALEKGMAGKKTKRGRLAHTNVTAGQLAHSGGEAWFASDREFAINGCSSRYRPRSGGELDDIVRAFQKAGFNCLHFGWNDEVKEPIRMPRGELKWLTS